LKDYIEERVLKVGKYIISSKATIRSTAIIFGVSKSTIHKDMTERLPKINPRIATEAKNILDHNKSMRHIRGGNATKKKYQSI
jgi:putative DeoR family transcriptional regulator (stage III sporulation protein D)